MMLDKFRSLETLHVGPAQIISMVILNQKLLLVMIPVVILYIKINYLVYLSNKFKFFLDTDDAVDHKKCAADYYCVKEGTEFTCEECPDDGTRT